MIPWLRRPNNNHRDSLFNLPLYPPAPKKHGGVDLASQQLTKDVNDSLMSFSVSKARHQLSETSEEEWQQRGEKRALALFHAAAEHVPAYQDFLKKNKIKAYTIKTLADFQQVTPVDKENYLRAYPLEQLCWFGDLSFSQMISFSSGSSGQPLYWPRGQILDAETTLEHELFISSFFNIDTKSTLLLNCFSMGMYVAGTITLNSVMNIGRKGYPITVVTPGIDMEDVIRVIPELSPHFDQIIIAGYPPFVKDILDEGMRAGINWQDISIKFILAGEGYSETWRKHISKIVNNGNPLYDFINLYGSADAAVLAHETPTSIITRSRLAEDDQAREKLFGCSHLPSLLQYFPEHKYFENVDNELIFSATGGIPLVRYNIHDKGGILSKKEITGAIPELDEYHAELRHQEHLWNLPFVYVFGKTDSTIMLYGLNIYPDNIKSALESEALRKTTTGRFTMTSEFNASMDQYLLINIELPPDTNPSQALTRDISDTIVSTLKKMNREYQKLFNSVGNKALPVVHLYKKGESDMFSRSGKQKWIRKNQ